MPIAFSYRSNIPLGDVAAFVDNFFPHAIVSLRVP
jgi:hypothetical protein